MNPLVLETAGLHPSAKCWFAGCEAPAAWWPVLLWPVFRKGDWPVRRWVVPAYLAIGVCTVHRAEVHRDQFATDAWYELTREALDSQGLILGDRSRMALEWQPRPGV